MSARDNILARVRGALAKPATPSPAERDPLVARLAQHAIGPRPQLPADRVAHFILRAQQMLSTTDRVATVQEVPAAVARYLHEQQLPHSGVAWPTLAGLDWAGAGLSMAGRPADGDDLVGVTGVFCAIAETGTLMFCSGPLSHAKTSLLPETHIAVVPADRIVDYMEDGWALMRQELGQNPRAVNFVSGPSRTADVENTINIGAHGPYRVHLIVVDKA